MSEMPDGRKLLVNLGSGPKGAAWLPAMFAGWRELRVDCNPQVAPDLLADITDLSALETGSVDAVWSAHCLEHLYLYQVGTAVSEACRILKDDGFMCVLVPDLQSIAEYIATDRLDEVVYQSPAGPVVAHDMMYGYGPLLAQGYGSMAHRCGFTPRLLLSKIQEAPFAEIVLRRRPQYELAAIASKRRPAGDTERETFLATLGI